MEIKEILDGLCGRDEQGNSLAQVGCYLYRADPNLGYENAKQIGSSITDLPEVNVFPNGEFVIIEITFLSEADTDLYKMNDLLSKQLELNRDEPEMIHGIVFNVLPASVDKGDTGVMEVIDPMFYCITSTKPHSPATTLRLLVKNDNVQFYDELDVTNTAVEADYEVKKRQDVEFYSQQKRAKNNAQAQYLDELRRKNKGV